MVLKTISLYCVKYRMKMLIEHTPVNGLLLICEGRIRGLQ